MAKKRKGRSRSKGKGNTWLLTGGLVVLLAAAGLYFVTRSQPAYGSLEAIGQGKPVIAQVFLPT